MAKAKANICEIETAHLNQQFFSLIFDLVKKGWKFYVVEQSRGRCYYHDKVVTIPKWAVYSHQVGYLEYYLCHEMAHCYSAGDNHGAWFMEQFKMLCPAEYQHYELGYKPGNAAAAGIKHKEIQYAEVLKINPEDLL
jgi:hypothetical protein